MHNNVHEHLARSSTNMDYGAKPALLLPPKIRRDNRQQCHISMVEEESENNFKHIGSVQHGLYFNGFRYYLHFCKCWLRLLGTFAIQ